MEGERSRIEIVPDPSIVIEKLIRPCMIWLDKAIGIILVVWGVLWLLKNVGILPPGFLGPGVVIVIGILCFMEIGVLWRKI